MSLAIAITVIPAEILVNVASYLELEDYKSLWSSCRHVESALLRIFVWDNFREIQVIRTEISLQTLVALSTPCLAGYVERVVVCSELLGTLFSSTERSVRVVDESRFLAASSHQHALLSTSHDRELLTEAFRNFGVDVVGMRDFGSFFAPPASFRPPTKALRMPGKAKLLWQIGIDISGIDRLQERYSNREEKEHCFRNILYALGRAAARPRRIEVEIGDSHGLSSTALWLPSFMKSCVPRVLADLR
ncbi:hypothetical protein GQ53DRAFT_837130 [Thozetella sp. PMI_491]|nr:hypothetical protein GQ53DRAFT_837130 [Thozetella sp. PMI_491]